MSFTDDAQEIDPTEDGGQADGLDGAYEADDTPVLPIDEYSGYRVPVRVDGEEMFVPLSEAVQGYQRQADYTRKTQEVAQQRQELQVVAAIKQALESDPQGTIQALAEHYGIAAAPQAQQRVSDDPFDSWGLSESSDTPDPRYSQLEQRLAAFEKAQAQQQLENELERLQAKYGDSFNPQEVLSQAVASGNSNLEAVYKLIDYDRVTAKSSVQTQQAAKAAQTVQAKKAAQVVSSGGSAGARAVADSPIRSIRDAWAAAKADHGV